MFDVSNLSTELQYLTKKSYRFWFKDTFLDSLALLTFVGAKVWSYCLYLQLLATGSCEYTRKLLGA